MTSEFPPEQTTKDITVVWRLVLASLVGVFAGCAALGYVWLFSYNRTHKASEQHAYEFLDIFSGVLSGIVYFPFGLLIATPLIILTLILGKLLEKSIDAHTGLWCLIAPPVLWMTTAMMLILPNDLHRDRSFFENMAGMFMSGENWVLIAGFGAAALAFYGLSTVKGREMLLRWERRKKAPAAQK